MSFEILKNHYYKRYKFFEVDEQWKKASGEEVCFCDYCEKKKGKLWAVAGYHDNLEKGIIDNTASDFLCEKCLIIFIVEQDKKLKV